MLKVLVIVYKLNEYWKGVKLVGENNSRSYNSGIGSKQKISTIFTSIENLPIKQNNEQSGIADYCLTL